MVSNMATSAHNPSRVPAPAELDGATLRQAFGAYPTGVVAIGALRGNEPVGFAASSFVSISLEPPMAAVSVARTSTTWPLLAEAPVLGLSVLSHGQGALCRRLASRNGNRFDGVSWQSTPDGAVLIGDAALWLTARVNAVYDGGDHEIVLMELLTAELFSGVEPLVFHTSQFRELIPHG
ncbi:oxidoreductase [Streptomyces sp. SID5473]|uniref:Flavin reductase n=2 Tax=Streptomyces TaxID=1883 RepID=I2N8C6_STRT9|nr:oxidoreductase [Streptomyces tsukubensis]EIF93273.1 putative oxidoreductase [Streptomyces tsukubensis NRRL18488]MYS68192.1 oxidoreductase [Streptomyces sp. SID5473]QKM66867.1 flavin reductase [Streptomyces tsukubensis NRRL18488]TAI44786.1 flavin reductase [Streptomyces tsukubensis]